MSKQIVFMNKNKCDIENDDCIITASQGQDYVNFVRNRSNRSAWVTTGSVDADNTTFEVDFGGSRLVDIIILIKHTFKSYTIQYWDGLDWLDFSTPVNVSNNASDTTYHEFTTVSTNKLLLTITGTITPDEDKALFQFIATDKIGRLNGWPVVDAPTFDKQKKRNKMLSGKENIVENLGGFACKLTIDVYSNEADLDVFEELYDSPEGFLVWLCGGDQDQFSTLRKGWRLEDVFLMRTASNYVPEFYKGLYQSGIVVDVPLVEVIT
jgi:hypothetical protein